MKMPGARPLNRAELASFSSAVRPTPRWREILEKPLLSGAAFLLVYLGLEWVSFIHEYKGLPITPWNPGLGVLFALLILGGTRYAVVLFLGALAAEFLVLRSDLPAPIIVAISAMIAAGYATVALITRRALHLDVGLLRLRDIFVLLVMGVVGAVVVALLLPLLLVVGGQLELVDAVSAAIPLFIGDAIGIAVMTPLTLRLMARTTEWTWRHWPLVVPEMLFYVVVVSIVFWGSGDVGGLKFFYLFYLPVVVAAVRHGLDGACVGLCLIQFMLVALSHVHGYDASAFTEGQSFMLVLTTTGLIVGVIVSERQAIHWIAREAEARLKEREAEAAQAARFNLMTGMASALAHEINQPITAARALARSVQEILRKPSIDSERAVTNLSTMIAQIDHAGDVIRRMREFMRRGRPHISTITVREMLEDSLILLQDAAASRGIFIDRDLPNDSLLIHGDAVQLQQVIVNLVQNAIDSIASESEGQGRIRISVVPVGDPPSLEFRIADNGPGLGSALAKRVFEPLMTSKPEGLGLGLAICASIVQSHGGRIWLESGERGATEFRFALPLQASESA